MTEEEIIAIVHEMLAAMSTVKSQRQPAYNIFLNTIRNILAKLPTGLKFVEIKSAKLSEIITEVWRRTFSNSQGIHGSTTKFDTLDIHFRSILINHGFYLDTTDAQGKSLLFCMFSYHKFMLFSPFLYKLAEQGDAARVVALSSNTRSNIFVYIEDYTLGVQNNRLPQYYAFIDQFVQILTDLGIQHQFSLLFLCEVRRPRSELKNPQYTFPEALVWKHALTVLPSKADTEFPANIFKDAAEDGDFYGNAEAYQVKRIKNSIA